MQRGRLSSTMPTVVRNHQVPLISEDLFYSSRLHLPMPPLYLATEGEEEHHWLSIRESAGASEESRRRLRHDPLCFDSHQGVAVGRGVSGVFVGQASTPRSH